MKKPECIPRQKDSLKNARNAEKEVKLNKIRGDWTRYGYGHITLKVILFKWYSAYKKNPIRNNLNHAFLQKRKKKKP